MRVIIGCERSQNVCKAFRARGHDAYSCDILPCTGNHPEWHILGNILDNLNDGWDILIAHPPCTRLCNSGVRWLHERNLWDELKLACIFFKTLLDCNIPKKAIENPIPHKYAIQMIGRKYDQIIQPYQFGHGETKATCLWLNDLPKLKATNIVKGREHRIHKMQPSDDRSMLRSITYPGIAKAMAEQWG